MNINTLLILVPLIIFILNGCTSKNNVVHIGIDSNTTEKIIENDNIVKKYDCNNSIEQLIDWRGNYIKLLKNDKLLLSDILEIHDSISLAISLAFGDTKVLDQNIKNKIETLNNREEYEISRDLLSDSITQENKFDSISFWISLDENVLNKLNENIKKSIMKFEYKKVDTLKETLKDTLWYLAPIGNLKIGWDAYNGDLGYQQNSKNVNKLKSFQISLLSIDQVKLTLSKYDVLKKSQQRLK